MMSYKEIAQQLILEEGIAYTPDQVRMICNRALAKLRVSEELRSYMDFLRDSDSSISQ